MVRTRIRGTIEFEGDTLAYKITGAGTPLLMIAGGGGNGDLYLPLADALSDEFRVITYDRRANAHSTMNHPDKFDLAQQARDAAAVLSASGETDAIVFGNSSGAVIGLEMLRIFPKKVRLLLAHEAPLAMLHPNANKWCSFFEKCKKRSFGIGGPSLAMSKFLFGIEVPTLKMIAAQMCALKYLKAEPPVNGKSEISSKEASKYLVRQELVPVTHYLPDLVMLKNNADKCVIAIGTFAEKHNTFLYQCSLGLANGLGKEYVRVPGHHASFMDDTDAWASCIRSLCSGSLLN